MRDLGLVALATMLMASAASAQSRETVTPLSGNTEVVTVTAPKLHQKGVPIVDLALARKAGVHDLDLATVYAREEGSATRTPPDIIPQRSARPLS
ncbi:MAG: hypothetical protein JOZ72_16780 [Alphaproteobacteria bacterium]|nr:hypothetical protein [Alphaproteobacteria bacterium]